MAIFTWEARMKQRPGTTARADRVKGCLPRAQPSSRNGVIAMTVKASVK